MQLVKVTGCIPLAQVWPVSQNDTTFDNRQHPISRKVLPAQCMGSQPSSLRAGSAWLLGSRLQGGRSGRAVGGGRVAVEAPGAAQILVLP